MNWICGKQELRQAAGEAERLREELEEVTAQSEEAYSQIGAFKQEADELRDQLAAASQVRRPLIKCLFANCSTCKSAS